MNRLAFFVLSAVLGAAVYGTIHLAFSSMSSSPPDEETVEPAVSGDATTRRAELESAGVIPIDAAESVPAGPEPAVKAPGADTAPASLRAEVTDATLEEEAGSADAAGASPRLPRVVTGDAADLDPAPGGGGTEEPTIDPNSQELVQQVSPVARIEPLPPVELSESSSYERIAEVAREAQAALQGGDPQTGLRLYREIFRVTRDREDIFVGPIVSRLLAHSSDNFEKAECLQYLAERDPRAQPRKVHENALAAARLYLGERGRESQRAAWSCLTAAYMAASSRSDRDEVTRLLEPFLDRHLFSGGYSPLLERHTVQPGESLAIIAKKYGTTIDAIKRINRLDSDVIQPRQGLLVLPGKLEIFVDKSEYRLWALVDGKLLLDAVVGLGVNDSTPTVTFKIVERQENPTWYPQGGAAIPPGDPRNILGSRWLGFEDTEKLTGFGIHGTPDTSSLGKESSSGCVRMRNEDIELLFDFTPRGTVCMIRD